jgi:hypothetical protein
MTVTPYQKQDSYIIQVDRGCDLASVARELSSLGFVTDQLLKRSSALSGRADPRLEHVMRSVAGVKHVRREGTQFTLPPFDPRVPQ